MESLCFRPPPTLPGISSPPIAVCLDARAAHHHPVQVSAVVRSGAAGAAVETSRHSYLLPWPLRRLWPGGGGGGVERGNDEPAASEGVERDEREDEEEEAAPVGGPQRENWVLKILRVRSIWEGEEKGKAVMGAGDGQGGDGMLDMGDQCVGCSDGDGSEGCHVGGDEGEVEFDRDSFSRLLRRVSLAEARLFSQLSYLVRLAYTIPKIKPVILLKYHGLRFVTSSLEKKSKPADVENVHSSPRDQEMEGGEEAEGERQRKNGYLISASAAYQIAASAASYLQYQTRSILPIGSAKSVAGVDSPEGGGRNEDKDITSSEVASFVATTNSVTAVVAAKEETKQAVAEDLNSAQSSPCEWFICDDDSSGTRFFIIQGSESLASWQANLLFEPIQFEGLDVLVHRGIYEAAKGIYEQMLPEVRAHLKSHGNSATLRFTGHSLGGSLSLLVNLMLLIRGEVPPSSLLPVITFGSPSIMCGGDYLLRKLGLPLSYVQAITMHRDIVPRAFSCNYPDHVAEILKAINGKFRNHPCLEHQKLLYAPMGELLILQPDEKFSPNHHLLPPGSGLYILGRGSPDSNDSVRLLQAAQSVFLNSPHPLEILSDRSAYGSDGTVYRDHDINAYLRSVRGVIRQELKRIRKAKREHRREMWWPLVAAQGIDVSIVMGRKARSNNSGPHQLSFSGVFQGGRESLKRFGRLVASRHVHMLVVLFLPMRLLLLDAFTVVSFS